MIEGKQIHPDEKGEEEGVFWGEEKKLKETRKSPPISISVHDTRKHIMGVGAGANEQQENEKKGLEVEYCGLFCVGGNKRVSIFLSCILLL